MLLKKLIIPLLCAGLSVTAHGQLRIVTDTEFGSGSVSGPGAGHSVVADKGTVSSILGVNYSAETENLNYYLDLSARATTDPVQDFRTLSLSRVQGRMTTGPHTVNFGDVMRTFSQYSLGATLKGLSYSAAIDGRYSPEISVIYGFQSPRWDSLFSTADDITVTKRQAYGASVSARPNEAWRVSAHYAGSSDSGRPGGWETLYEGGVYGMTWGFEPFDGLALTGETSFSGMRLRPAQGSSENRSGSANKVSFRGYGDGLRLDLDYERVSTGFLSVLGSASPDRERARASWTQEHGPLTTVRYTGLWFRDNLDSSKSKTSHSIRPDIRVTRRRLFERRYASGDLNVRLDRRTGYSDDTGVYADMGYRDRFGQFDSETRLGLASLKSSTRESVEYVANTSLGTRKSFGSIILRPNLRIGTRIYEDARNESLDLVHEASLGSSVDVPGIGISAGLQGGIYNFIREAGDGSARTFLNAHAYHRPGFGGGAYTIYIRYSLNDFKSEDSDRNFSENFLTAGISVQY